MLYTHNPKENDYHVDIIGDPENGCILPPGEYKKLKEDPTLLYSLEQYIGATQGKILQALDIRSTQYLKPSKPLYRHGYTSFQSERNGKTRDGFKPHKLLKEIQVLLHRRLLNIPISPSITSGNRYWKGDGIKNGKMHLKNPYTITLDIKKAYPSINTHRVYKNMEGALFRNLNILAPLLTTSEQKQLFVRAVTHLLVWNNQLPEGSPTSPAVCDIVVSKLDAELLQQTLLQPINNPLITRYRDDITFSFQSHRSKVLQSIKEVGNIWNESYLPLNPATNQLSRAELYSRRKRKPSNSPDAVIYKFIKGIGEDKSLLSNTFKSKDYKQVIKYLRDKSDDINNGHLQETKENLYRYMDSILEKTQSIVDSIYERIAITNDVDQKDIETDLITLKDNLQKYITEYDTAYGVHERHNNKIQEIIKQINDTSIIYPQKTIGDVSQEFCKTLRNQGYKVNLKKLKSQSPGSPFPIEITGLAKMADGRKGIPNKLKMQYSKALTNLSKLSPENLEKHPYYAIRFFRNNSFLDGKKKVLNYVQGITNHMGRIYSENEYEHRSFSTLPKKLREDSNECIRRWQHATSRDDIAATADEKYNLTYQYDIRETPPTGNETKPPKEEGGSVNTTDSVDDLPF